MFDEERFFDDPLRYIALEFRAILRRTIAAMVTEVLKDPPFSCGPGQKVQHKVQQVTQRQIKQRRHLALRGQKVQHKVQQK